jgi:hypothetical protein
MRTIAEGFYLDADKHGRMRARLEYCDTLILRKIRGGAKRAPALRIAKMIQQPFQPDGDISGIRMLGIQLDFEQLLLIKDQVARDSQHIFHQASWPQARQPPGRKHPLSRPRQQVVGQIRQQNQALLRRLTLFSTSCQPQSTLVGLDFGFAGTTRIIVSNHLGWRPLQNRTHDNALFQFTALRAPAQSQPLHRTGQGDWCHNWCDPPIIRTQLQPGVVRHLANQGRRAPATTALGHNLPTVLQGAIHVAITSKARVRAQDDVRFLGRAEGQKAIQRRHDRQIGRAALLFAGVQL